MKAELKPGDSMVFLRFKGVGMRPNTTFTSRNEGKPRRTQTTAQNMKASLVLSHAPGTASTEMWQTVA